MSSPNTETAGPTDHPAAGVHSLWRLRHYLRPHRLSMAIMLGTALVGVGLSIAIPLVTKAMIDGPIAHHETGPVLPLGLLALALGVLEAVLIFWRRWVQSNAVLGVETAMRRDLYARLQSLPMAFHGQWQSGQLLSRVTTDLSSIRRFTGFGMLFLVINVLQLVVVTGVLLHMYWPLGLVVAAVSVPIIVLSNRFERRYVVISRQVQDQQGDLATLAEEGAVGIRVIKSFGRGPLRRRPVRRRRADALRHLDGQGPAVLEVLDLPRGHPQLRGGRGAAARRARRRPRRPDARHPGRLHHADAVAGVADRGARLHPRDGPGGDDRRRPRARDLRHRAVDRLRRHGHRAPARPPAPRGRRLRVPRPARRAGAARRQPRRRARRDGRDRRRHRLRQDHADRPRAPAVRRDRRPRDDRRGRRTRPEARRPARRSWRPPSRSRRCSR